MIRILADNIHSPLGETTEANVQAVRRGESALREHRLEGLPEPFVASLLEPSLTFEEGLKRTIAAALAEARDKGEAVDISAPDVVLILSSTKGNVADLECIGDSARKVAQHFGHTAMPIVVSNACISGLSAQILAMRLLRTGQYRYAVVAGMDVQGPFIVSGFQSFKALSPEPCRPFDGDRCGLNLGEAAACLILKRDEQADPQAWYLDEGAVRNDATHISNPSRTGEGSWRALQQVTGGNTHYTCISAHGTATLDNDEMEASAISRAGLAEVPTFSLKGYYGHTMGAAGLLETIVTLHAVQEGWIPATRGYAEEGTSHPIHVTSQEEQAEGRSVLKLLSGFGGCNAALHYEQGAEAAERASQPAGRMECRATVTLTPADMPQGMTASYKEQVGDYPKFYKMDPLCKLGFLAVEQLLAQEDKNEDHSEDRAVVLFSRHGSMADDKDYYETIQNPEEFFPSPAVFVYTLSNIVTGEIAIRHHYQCETSCYILPNKDKEVMKRIIETTFQDRGVRDVIAGWVDYQDEEHYEAEIGLFEMK